MRVNNINSKKHGEEKVVQLVEALSYKPEVGEFDTR
jgi:hypothetical protein